MSQPAVNMRLVGQMAWREWRAGELWVFVFALSLAVMASTTVALFSDRLERGLLRQGGDLLAADLVVQSPSAIPNKLKDFATAQGLQQAQTLEFPSVVFTNTVNSNSSLAAIKAVSEGYPLRGQLEADAAEAQASDTNTTALGGIGIPAAGEVWVDPVLLAKLQISLGTQIALGAAELRVTRILRYEPDRSGSFVALAPRLLMNLADIPQTELVQAGSRVTWRLLLASSANAIASVTPKLKAELDGQQRLRSPAEARPELSNVLERALRMLRLATLITLLLAAVAILITGRQYARQRADAVALLKTLGASGRQIMLLYGGVLLLAGCIAFLFGSLLGAFGQAVIAELLASLIPQALPPPRLAALFGGLLTLGILLPACTLPFLDSLRRVTAVRVLRGTQMPLTVRSSLSLGLGLLASGLLLWWQLGDLRLGLYVLGGVFCASLLFWLIARALQRLVAQLGQQLGGSAKTALLRLTQGAETTSTLVSLMIGIGLLMLLSVLGDDVMQAWSDSLPTETPNSFAINIQNDQLPALESWFAERDINAGQNQPAEFYPLVRARLTAINEQPVADIEFDSERAERNANREYNLSWQAALADDNELSAGRWWREDEHGQALISMEIEFAERLNIQLGDSVSFNIAGATLTAKVLSLRKVDWDSFRGNFFVLFPPGVLEDYPYTSFTALYVDETQRSAMPGLMQAFPGIAVLDISAVLEQIRQIMQQLVAALRFIFLLTLVAGLTVLLAALQATAAERRMEIALLRSLGASRGLLLRAGVYEFLALAVLAALPAALLGYGLSAAIAVYLLEIPWQAGHSGLLVLLLATLLITCTGWLAVRRSVNTPAMQIFRR